LTSLSAYKILFVSPLKDLNVEVSTGQVLANIPILNGTVIEALIPSY